MLDSAAKSRGTTVYKHLDGKLQDDFVIIIEEWCCCWSLFKNCFWERFRRYVVVQLEASYIMSVLYVRAFAG